MFLSPMEEQRDHYRQFAQQYRDKILNSPDPSFWATDMASQGPNFLELQERISHQIEMVEKYFDPGKPVLDLGCGFGRQTIKLAEKGFKPVGVDFSEELIAIAHSWCQSKQLSVEFICQPITTFKPNPKHSQILLLDVWEHLPPRQKPAFLDHLITHVCEKNARLLVTFPHLNAFSWRYRCLNAVKNLIGTKLASRFDAEHPYRIPSVKKFSTQIKPIFETISQHPHGRTQFWILELR